MSNMTVWDKVKRPPEDALKKIGGGRLKGMTDISPQWRYQILTEVFGICGIGWKYDINRLWTETGSHEQVMAFAEISLYVKHDGEWSDSIPGIGGAAFIVKESSGLHTSDEAYKMAVTDALSVALKMLGVAADIYAGKWDGSKYKDPVIAESKVMPEKKFNELKNLIEAQQTDEATKAEFQKVLEICREIKDADSYNKLKEIAVNHRKFLKKVAENE